MKLCRYKVTVLQSVSELSTLQLTENEQLNDTKHSSLVTEKHDFEQRKFYFL